MGALRLLPRLQDKITANYPGTRLAITEYNYGGASHISQTAGIAITHTAQFNKAQVYELTHVNSVPQRKTDLDITLTNAFQYSMPANSMFTLVLLP